MTNKMKNSTKTKNHINTSSKTSTIAILSVIALLFFSCNVFGLELGLTPADANFENVLSGGYAEIPFTLSTDSQKEVTINLYNLDDSSVNDWISYEPSPEFVMISQAKPYSGKVILRVPEGASDGNYSILNKFTILQPLSPAQSDTQADIALSMGQRIRISVVGNTISGCTVYSNTMQTQAVVGQDILTNLFLRNDGNVDLEETLNYIIYDVNRTKILLQGSLPFQVLPTRVETVSLKIPAKNLPVGQYSVALSTEKCGYSKDSLQFTLFAQGEKFVKGELRSVLTTAREFNLTSTPITGVFVNSGDVAITSHMISKVMLDGKTVDIIESKSASVLPGKEVTFVNNLIPKSWGKHQIDTYVVYESYQTPKTISYINFIDESVGKDESSSGFSTAKMIIFGVIVLLIILIVLKKRKTKF